MSRRWFALLAALGGCRRAVEAPAEPGTSVALEYPVLLIGQNDLTVRDDEAALTRTTGASSLNFVERQVVDSAGVVYEVKRAVIVNGGKAVWQDMGTSPQRVWLELNRRGPASVERIRGLVMEQVRSPLSVWEGKREAVARVESFGSVKELIEGCRTSWEWGR
jgi:hypothetical protein